MEITVVGSGTVVPRLERRQSCVVVRSGQETFVFDLGSGAVRGMLACAVDPFSVDRIFLTHFHPDHTSDLVPLIFSTNYGSPQPRTRPLEIVAPTPFQDFWEGICRAWGDWIYAGYPLRITELPREYLAPLQFTSARLSWAPAEHRPESVAYRIEEGSGAFVYTGDTAFSPTVVELARGAHTLLIECSAPDGESPPGHLTPAGVARIASGANVSRVVLTHLYPQVETLDLVSEVGRGFDGEVIVAEDGLVLSV